MFKSKSIDEIVASVSENLPDQVSQFKDDFRKNFRSLLEGKLAELDLVTRKEFDAQTKVLHATREKLEALEKKLNEL